MQIIIISVSRSLIIFPISIFGRLSFSRPDIAEDTLRLFGIIYIPFLEKPIAENSVATLTVPSQPSLR